MVAYRNYGYPMNAEIKRNLKICADVADKICFGRTEKFGSGSGFSATLRSLIQGEALIKG